MTWNPECVVTEHELQKATDEGWQYGKDAGSWVVDGNTTVETAQWIIKGIEDGDPEVMDLQPSPLSGEWAGESIPELSARFGIDLENNEIASAFENGYSDGFWNVVESDARYKVGE